MKMILVNPFHRGFWLFWLVVVGGCGFELNRNQLGLPAGARSLALLEVDNQTFVSGLGLQVQQELSGLFTRAGVPLKQPKRADLALKVEITSSQRHREDLSEFDVTSYRFVFIHSAKITLIDNRTEQTLFDGAPLDGRFDLETNATELSNTEIREGQRFALEQLAEKIAQKLTQNF